MVIGPVTIRWTKDIKAEQAARIKAKAISAKMVELMLYDNRRFKAILRRWGLSDDNITITEAEDVLKDVKRRQRQGAFQRSKPPKGAVASV